MIVCSCNKITTDQLRAAAHYLTDPSPRMLLDMIAWQPNCAICAQQLVSEARKAIEEVTNHGD
jgi:bacterioferritin-associated ferredoxin